MRVHIIRTEFFGRKSRKALFFIAQKIEKTGKIKEKLSKTGEMI